MRVCPGLRSAQQSLNMGLPTSSGGFLPSGGSLRTRITLFTRASSRIWEGDGLGVNGQREWVSAGGGGLVCVRVWGGVSLCGKRIVHPSELDSWAKRTRCLR